MNYSLLFHFPAKRLLEEQLSNYIRRHLEEKGKRQRAVCIQNVEGLRLAHHLPDPWSSSEPATGCCLLPLWESHISPVEGCHQADINYSFMNDLASILAARNNFSLTWQDPQEQHPVCWLVFLLVCLSDASPLVKEACFGWGRDPLAHTVSVAVFCQTPTLPGKELTSALFCCFLVLLWSLQRPAPCRTAKPRDREWGGKLQMASIRLCSFLPDPIHLKACSVFSLPKSKPESVTSVWKRNLSSAPALPLVHRCLSQKCCTMRESTGGRLN